MAVLSLSYHSVLTLYLINNSIYRWSCHLTLYYFEKEKTCFHCALYEYSVYLLVLGTHLYFVVQGQTSKESESYKKGTNVDTM